MRDTDSTQDRRFSRAETGELIRRATELQQQQSETLSYAQLVEVAGEVGIDKATVDATLRQAEDDAQGRRHLEGKPTSTVIDRCLELLCLRPRAG